MPLIAETPASACGRTQSETVGQTYMIFSMAFVIGSLSRLRRNRTLTVLMTILYTQKADKMYPKKLNTRPRSVRARLDRSCVSRRSWISRNSSRPRLSSVSISACRPLRYVVAGDTSEHKEELAALRHPCPQRGVLPSPDDDENSRATRESSAEPVPARRAKSASAERVDAARASKMYRFFLASKMSMLWRRRFSRNSMSSSAMRRQKTDRYSYGQLTAPKPESTAMNMTPSRLTRLTKLRMEKSATEGGQRSSETLE